jgi:beta-aspartyl-peptidase (threonine type)
MSDLGDKWIVVSSQFGVEGIDSAAGVLAEGGTALDAVEAGTKVIESQRDEHTVGLGGYPNLHGEVELDASIMDGTTLAYGAVGALRGYRHAITVARAVMEQLPHVLVVGEGAARLAKAIGLTSENLLTEEAEEVWRKGLEGTLEEESYEAKLMALTGSLIDRTKHLGTVNFLARDNFGHIASGVSTSGVPWKYPGRLGDSPILGAGNYADDRYGAAGCTGHGELSIRAGTARAVVANLRSGKSLEESCLSAIRDLFDLVADDSNVYMNVVGLDREGNHIGVSTWDETFYVYRTDGMSRSQTQSNMVIRR